MQKDEEKKMDLNDIFDILVQCMNYSLISSLFRYARYFITMRAIPHTPKITELTITT